MSSVLNDSSNDMHVESFFDVSSSTISHIIVDTATGHCAVLDSVLGYDMYSATTDTQSADQIIAYIEKQNLENQWLLETHIHADHLSAAQYLKRKIGGTTAMGSGIVKVLKHWVPVFDTANDTPLNGQQFDQLFAHQQQFKIGQITVSVLHTPGHTPACVCYAILNTDTPAVFVGDTLFAPQRGTARVDFPDGDAKQLFDSIQCIYQMPDHTTVYLCHDYPTTKDELVIKTTVGEEKQHNTMLQADTPLDAFIETRTQRDQTLAVPKLIYPAIQTNMRLGALGPTKNNGVQYLRIPLNQYNKDNN